MTTTRDPFAPRQVVGRRGGRVKQPLSHERIVDTALALLARDGLEGMSLRNLAKALDTGPASLYVYVADLHELQARVLDRALARVSTKTTGNRPWRTRLEAVLRSYYQVLARDPGLARLALSTIAAGPNALHLIEALLELLDQAGVDETTAAWAVDLILLYVTSIAFEQSQRAKQVDPMGSLAGVIGAVPAAEYPRVHRARAGLLSGSGKARFDWALHVMLEGILRVRVPSKQRAAAPRRGATKHA
jgi:AcrR family transcriptional regulator